MKIVGCRISISFSLCLIISLLLLTGLLLPLSSFANGQGESDRLALARRLIDEKKYDEANTLLAEIIKTEPQKFEKAQKLAQEIIQAQNSFNNVYEDLIRAIDEGNVDKALSNIKILNELDPDPNETVVIALNKAKYSAEIAVNLKTFNQIMTTALAQLNQAQYLPAIDTYLTGFEMHKEDFFTSGYGNVVEDATNRALTKTLALLESFRQKEPAYILLQTSLHQTIQDGSLTDYHSQQALFINEYLALLQLATEMKEPATSLKTQYENLKGQNLPASQQQEGEKPKSGLFYLYYLDKLISGRRETTQAEGIQNTISLLAQESLNYLEDKLKNKAHATRSARDGAFKTQEVTATRAFNQSGEILYNSLMQLGYLMAFGKVHSPVFDIKSEKELILKDGFPQLADYQEKLKEIATFEILLTLLAKRLTYTPVAGTTQTQTAASINLPTSAELAVFVQNVQQNTEKYANLIFEWVGWRDKLKSLDSFAASDANSMLTLIGTELSRYLGVYQQHAQVYLQELEKRLINDKNLLLYGEEARSVVADETDASSTRYLKYPNKRVASFHSIKQYVLTLNDHTQRLSRTWVAGYDGKSPDTKTPALSPELLQSIKNGELEDMLNQLNGLLEKGANLAAETDTQLNLATEEMLEAERFKKEGIRYYNATQTAYKQRDYAKARETLQSASLSFDKSLEKQEDTEIRYLRDTVFPDFIVKINQAENERVVGEVRSLLEKGIQTYRENRFEEAETIIVKAQTRWQDTNKSINEEIEAWLSVVQRARNLHKGWEITEIEPLYPEITQRLNRAVDAYNLGLQRLKEGNTASANLNLQSAIETLDNIKISYPLLKEANILRLKINKELNPTGFNSDFEQNLEEAELVLKNRQTPPIQAEYSTLKEYELVLANNQRLKNIINDIEIYLGIKQRPPSQGDITQSKEKVQTSLDIYNKRQRDLYPKAIELLNEAIKLWPDNSGAKQLKDKLQIARGEVIQSIITADDQQALGKAEKLYSERNYAESYTITQKLLKKAANRNYPPLTELNEKNEVRLGIK